EKTPDNVLYLPMLGRLFPNAQFLHVIRDGRDCAVSGWFHNLRISKEWAESEFGDFAAFAEHYAQGWAKNLRAGREFGARNSERYCEIRYEDLLSGGETELRRVLDFLGARIDKAEIINCLEASSFRSLANGRASGEEDRESHFRKGVQGDWRAHFDDDTLAAFRSHAGAQLDALGYGD
ncbi:MAG: sulfotransferase, partial [Alphaproteobacteria bacterium]